MHYDSEEEGLVDGTIIDMWAVHQGDTDRDNGRPKWFFSNACRADIVSKNRGWWGGTAPISRCKGVVIKGKIYQLASEIPIILNEGPDDILAKKTAALAKLTEEDKKALGFA